MKTFTLTPEKLSITLDEFQLFLLTQIRTANPESCVQLVPELEGDSAKQAFELLCKNACVDPDSMDSITVYKYLREA